MSWMSEVAIMIDEARAYGVSLDVSDFGRDGDALTIDGMDADQWFTQVVHDSLTCPYCGRQQTDMDTHLQYCEPMR